MPWVTVTICNFLKILLMVIGDRQSCFHENATNFWDLAMRQTCNYWYVLLSEHYVKLFSGNSFDLLVLLPLQLFAWTIPLTWPQVKFPYFSLMFPIPWFSTTIANFPGQWKPWVSLRSPKHQNTEMSMVENSHRQEVLGPAPEAVRPGCPSDRQCSAAFPATCPTWCSVSVRWQSACWTTSRPRLRPPPESCTGQTHTAGAARPSGYGSRQTGRSNPYTQQRQHSTTFNLSWTKAISNAKKWNVIIWPFHKNTQS